MHISHIKSVEKTIAKTIDFLSTNNILPINIFILKCDGSIVWANNRLLGESNETLESILNKNVSLFGEVAAEGLKRVVNQKKEEIVEEEYKGSYFITCRYPISAENNEKIEYVMGISINITKIKQAHLKNMAHDLRTPLTGMIGLAQLQEMGLDSLEEYKQYGQMICGAGNQLLELLNAVISTLDTEHMTDSVKVEPLDLSGFARELFVLMEPAVYTQGLKFKLEVDKDLPLIVSDRIKLKRILINLLSNAVKFTQQGKISLAIKLLSIENNHASIEMRVSDTGIGIAEENLTKIFDRFYRVHPAYLAEYTGHGMGLYLVKEALNLLGGEINVSSKQGEGTCFVLHFEFPLLVGSSLCAELSSPN
jgi:two-component system aerobic respiration control sensor histidine kinase ArcB